MEFKVTGNITHDGQAYTSGDTIKLSQEQAAPLIEIGVLEDPNAPEEAKPAKPRTKKDSKKNDAPEVGGESVETGEPSVDGPSEPTDTAEDVTPVVEDPAVDPSADL